MTYGKISKSSKSNGPPVAEAFRFKGPPCPPVPNRIPRREPDKKRAPQDATNGYPGYIRARGLPSSATAQDVCDAFREFRIPLPNIYMGVAVRGPKAGRPDGQCIIKVPNARMVDQIIGELHHVKVQDRYLELFPSDEEDYCQSWEEGRLMEGPPGEKWQGRRQYRDHDRAGSSETYEHRPTERKGKGKGDRARSSEAYENRPKDGKGKGKGKGAPRKPKEFDPFPEASEDDGVLRIRGLPFSVSPGEVVSAFARFGIEERNVYLGIIATGPRAGQPDGQAFVQFPSAEIAKEVENECQGEMVGNRYLEIYQSSEEDLAYQIRRGCARESCENPFEEPGAGYVRLRGLPYSATKSEIVDFFGGEICEADVTFRYDKEKKRPCGEAYVLLDSEDAAITAQQELDRKTVGGRFVEVFLSSAGEVNRFARPSPYERRRN